MGTDWKKSKLAARILCGWLGMMSLLAALLCLLACGPAMLGGSSVGMGDLLAGQLSGSVYYQEKMAELFYNCSLLAAGGAAGDGTPLTAGQNTQLRSQARDALNNDSGALSSGQVLFAVLPDSESGVSYSNTDFALWEDGRVAAPLGYSVALASTGGASWGNRALLAAYSRLLTSQTVHPSAEGLENAVVVLAVQDGAGPWLPGFVGEGLRQVETLAARCARPGLGRFPHRPDLAGSKTSHLGGGAVLPLGLAGGLCARRFVDGAARSALAAGVADRR